MSFGLKSTTRSFQIAYFSAGKLQRPAMRVEEGAARAFRGGAEERVAHPALIDDGAPAARCRRGSSWPGPARSGSLASRAPNGTLKHGRNCCFIRWISASMSLAVSWLPSGAFGCEEGGVDAMTLRRGRGGSSFGDLLPGQVLQQGIEGGRLLPQLRRFVLEVSSSACQKPPGPASGAVRDAPAWLGLGSAGWRRGRMAPEPRPVWVAGAAAPAAP